MRASPFIEWSCLWSDDDRCADLSLASVGRLDRSSKHRAQRTARGRLLPPLEARRAHSLLISMISEPLVPNFQDGGRWVRGLNDLTMSVHGGSRVDDKDWMPRAKVVSRTPIPGIHDRRCGPQFVRLILIESGGAGLEEHAASDDTEQTVALAQGDGEPIARFSLRVVQRIRVLERARLSVERTFLLLGPRFDTEATLARLLIARILITHSVVASGNGSALVLSASSSQRSETQRWLPRLVDALIGEARSGAVSIAVNYW
jgi:hypothetical protein